MLPPRIKAINFARHMNLRFNHLLSWLLLLCFPARAYTQAPALHDSTLRETLTRAVQCWQSGKAREAYISLDTIAWQSINPGNASTKIKASLWTANFLQAQRKVKAASPFLDSALRWSEQYALGDELLKSYEAYSEWHLQSGNPKTAIVAREAAWKIRDSLNRREMSAATDSLQDVITGLSEKIETLQRQTDDDRSAVQDEAGTWKKWVYILSALCALLVVIIFLMNGTLQRLRHSPPSPAPSLPRAMPPIQASVPAPEATPSSKKPASTAAGPAAPTPLSTPPAVSAPAEISRPAAPSGGRDITYKLQEVELVLIRPEILGKYNNGETKAIRNILNEYMAQLPFIMKTLDEAIGKNESSPILLSLEHLRQYLVAFGMQGTLKLILEIEEESKTEKVAKLLSRVFQVRNHCRRAADEAKALLEKIG